MKAIIDHNPHIALSDLKELFRLSEGSASFTANGVQYTIVFSLEEQICAFIWEYNGKKKQEKIELRKEPSNLGQGYVWYFVCPCTRRKCRKLFLDGNIIASRYAFNHVYSIQMENKQNIFFRKLGKLDDPRKKYGKPLYRGKITLYGKKIQKHRKRQQIINENIGKYIPSFMFNKTKKNL